MPGMLESRGAVFYGAGSSIRGADRSLTWAH